LYVINLPVLWDEHRETSADLSNNYNHNLPVFNSPDRIYNANFRNMDDRKFQEERKIIKSCSSDDAKKASTGLSRQQNVNWMFCNENMFA
jgi:hypothetical protein